MFQSLTHLTQDWVLESIRIKKLHMVILKILLYIFDNHSKNSNVSKVVSYGNMWKYEI